MSGCQFAGVAGWIPEDANQCIAVAPLVHLRQRFLRLVTGVILEPQRRPPVALRHHNGARCEHAGQSLRQAWRVPLSIRIRRVEKDDVEAFAGGVEAGQVIVDVTAQNPYGIETLVTVGPNHVIQVAAQHFQRAPVHLDKRDVRSPARECFDAKRSGAREQVENPRTLDVAEDRKHRLAYAVAGGSRGAAARPVQAMPLVLARNYTHDLRTDTGACVSLIAPDREVCAIAPAIRAKAVNTVVFLGGSMSRGANPNNQASEGAYSRRTAGTIGPVVPRMIALLAFALLLAFVVAGCGDDGEAVTGDEPPTQTTTDDNYGYPADEPRKNDDGELLPPPVQIYGADKSGKKVSKDTVVIVKSQKQFEKLQKELFAGQKERPLPGTDFATRQMIVVLLEPKKDGAQAQVEAVRDAGDTFTVQGLRLLPGKGCPGQTANTNPYMIVETDKLKGKAILKVENQDRPPC